MRSLLMRSIALLGILMLLAGVGLARPHHESVPNPNQVGTDKPLMPEDSRSNYISESFETEFPPPGWTTMTSGEATHWGRVTTYPHSGEFCAAVFYGPPGAMQDEWLVTPALDVSAAADLRLEFFEREWLWANNGLRHSIMVSYTAAGDPSAFSPVEVWTPGNHTIPDAYGAPVLVDLSAHIGQPTLHVAFRYEGESADAWFIDDVRIYERSDHDVAATNALPVLHQDGGTAITPQAVVKNIGQNTESLDVSYEILDGGTVVYSQIASVSGLAPDASATVTFPDFVPAEGLWYDTQATTLLGGDEDPSNDRFWGGFHTYLLSHVPMIFDFTNSGCPPCVAVNQALDAYMPRQGNEVALVRIHTWWPNPADIMYVYNPPQCDAYVAEYDVTGVPNLWLDGNTFFHHTDLPEAMAAFEAAKYNASPMGVTPIFYNQAGEQLLVEVEIWGALPESDYRLVCMFTEDNIAHNGGNDELIHMQAFRYAYPDGLEGMPISTEIGTHSYIIDMPLDPNNWGDWVFENLRATCYVQDRGSADFRQIIESGTNFLTNLLDATSVAVSSPVLANRILNNYPNPFNPKTAICFSLEQSGTVKVSVFDLQGRRVADLFNGVKDAGEHEVSWEAQGLGSGIYFVRLAGEGFSDSRKVVLAK